MLAVVVREAAARGYGAIESCLGAAEVLPFESNTFDLVVTRYSAHHWANMAQALAECAGVRWTGGHQLEAFDRV
jgi:ubiquinone/menaquinone biosynthesis C-methylase UbiE